MFYTVYKITNKLNGKIYIGKHQTNNLDDGYMGSGKHLRRAISKYGIKNFEKEYLFIYDNEDDMNKKEAEIVTEDFCKQDDNYNLCRGGSGGFSYVNRVGKNLYGMNGKTSNVKNNFVRAKETQRKLWEENGEWAQSLRRKHSLIAKERFAVTGGNFLGKKHSDETKQKIGAAISVSQSGTRNSQYGTIWITDGNQSKKISKDSVIPAGWTPGRKIKKTKSNS